LGWKYSDPSSVTSCYVFMIRDMVWIEYKSIYCLLLATANSYSIFTVIHSLQITTMYSKSSQSSVSSLGRCLIATSNNGDPVCCFRVQRLLSLLAGDCLLSTDCWLPSESPVGTELVENTVSRIHPTVACASFAMGACFNSYCLETDVFSDSKIPASRRHVVVYRRTGSSNSKIWPWVFREWERWQRSAAIYQIDSMHSRPRHSDNPWYCLSEAF
jgi:hypothetical protein